MSQIIAERSRLRNLRSRECNLQYELKDIDERAFKHLMASSYYAEEQNFQCNDGYGFELTTYI